MEVTLTQLALQWGNYAWLSKLPKCSYEGFYRWKHEYVTGVCHSNAMPWICGLEVRLWDLWIKQMLATSGRWKIPGMSNLVFTKGMQSCRCLSFKLLRSGSEF